MFYRCGLILQHFPTEKEFNDIYKYSKSYYIDIVELATEF